MGQPVRLRDDVADVLHGYISYAKAICPVGSVITESSVVNEILMKFLSDPNNYPPKGSVSERRETAGATAAIIVPTNTPVLEDRPLEPSKDSQPENTNDKDAVSIPSAIFTPSDLGRVE